MTTRILTARPRARIAVASHRRFTVTARPRLRMVAADRATYRATPEFPPELATDTQLASSDAPATGSP